MISVLQDFIFTPIYLMIGYPLLGCILKQCMDHPNFKCYRSISSIAKQTLQGLHFLKLDEISHADLKPDNIMFVSPDIL